MELERKINELPNEIELLGVKEYQIEQYEFKLEPRYLMRDEAVTIIHLWIEHLEGLINGSEKFLSLKSPIGNPDDQIRQNAKGRLKQRREKLAELVALEEEWLSHSEDWEIDVAPFELKMLFEAKLVSPGLLIGLMKYNPYGDSYNLNALGNLIENLCCWTSNN